MKRGCTDTDTVVPGGDRPCAVGRIAAAAVSAATPLPLPRQFGPAGAVFHYRMNGMSGNAIMYVRCVLELLTFDRHCCCCQQQKQYGRNAPPYLSIPTIPYLHNLISVQCPRSTRYSSVVTLARPPTSSSLKSLLSLCFTLSLEPTPFISSSTSF